MQRPGTLLAQSLLATALSIAFASPASADTSECEAFANATPPKRDLPTPADRKRLAECEPATFYYGIDRPADAKNARLCAAIELEQDDARWLPLHDAGMLMMIYANGHGVPRNARIAKHYACQMEGGWKDLDHRFDDIDEAVAGHKKLDACDGSGWGMPSDECAMVVYRVEISRAHDAQRPLLQWAMQQHGAFDPLRTAASNYERARKPVEVDRLEHYTNQAWREAVSIEQFNAVLSALQHGDGDLPSSDLDVRDRELNAVYQRVLLEVTQRANDNANLPDMLQPAQLRAVERAWLAYATACERFRIDSGSVLSSNALRRLLTAQRIEALRAMFYSVGVDEAMRPVKF